MKHKYKYLIFFFFLAQYMFSSAYVQAQATTLTPSIESVVPPSPNVSAINKFGNIPIGQSTGIPSVGVPIYSWNGKNFGKSVSVSLNYHAGGIKVSEAASNVGLGWALNAGGVVSRTMRGLYDEMPTYGFFDANIPSTEAGGNNTGGVPNNERTFFKMNAGVLDSQNDIFNYNFNGQSGRFVLGKDNRILFLEQTKIKVERFLSTINGKTLFSKFIITDEFGYRYVFEDYEITSTLGMMGANSSYTSAWHLTRIITPSGNSTIEFEYENYNVRNEYLGSSTIAEPLFGDGIGYPATMGGGSAQDVSGKRIKKINFPDGNTVDFYYSSISRSDMPGDHLLEKIKVSKGDVTFGFRLTQDYSISGRATLKTVTPIGGALELQNSPYSFEYDMQYVLPARLSTSQDHWGYANLNNGSFIPHEYVRAPGGAYNPFREFPGGNRNTDPDRIKSGSLKKITYPTGGHTIFEMEANTAKDNWLEQNDTVTVTNPPYADKSLNEGLNSDNYPAASIPLLFNGDNGTTTNFDITINPLAGSCGGGCAILFELYDASNSFVGSQQINFTDPSPDPYSITRSFSLTGLIKGQTYSFKVYTINVSGYYEYVEIKWREMYAGGSSQVVLSRVQPYVGGLRVKRISDYVSLGSVASNVREFDYVKEDGLTSSGSLGFRPVYTTLVKYDYHEDPTAPQEPSYSGFFNFNYALRSSSTANDIAYANGSPVTYSRVVERIMNNGITTGKTVRHFTDFREFPPVTSDVYPSVPTQYVSWNYGLLKKEEMFNANNLPVKKVENTYVSHNDPYGGIPSEAEAFRSITIAPVKFQWNGAAGSPPHIVPTNSPHYFLMNSFWPWAGRVELTGTQVTNYFEGQERLVTTTTNDYDTENFYIKHKTITNSKGEEVKNRFLYPKDRVELAENASLYSAMLSNNMIRNSVGQQELNGNNLVAEQRTDYFNWSGNLYAPQLVRTQAAGGPMETRISYQDYDVYGAVVSVKQESGIPICYVWGYGGEHVVAIITNATYPEVMSAMGGIGAVTTFRNTKSPTDLEVQAIINNLRVTLANAQVQGFTYNTLSGITSQTDVKGLATYFEYDEFLRLKHIKDQNGDIVKSFCYNYANAPVACGTAATPIAGRSTFSLNYSFQTYGYREFQIAVSDISSGQTEYYYVNSNSSGTLSNIPGGMGSITINEINYTGSYNFYLDSFTQNGVYVQFGSMTMGGNMNLYISEL